MKLILVGVVVGIFDTVRILPCQRVLCYILKHAVLACQTFLKTFLIYLLFPKRGNMWFDCSKPVAGINRRLYLLITVMDEDSIHVVE